MSIVKFWHVFCTISSVSFSGRSGPGPLGPVRKILEVRSGPEGPQFARSVGTLLHDEGEMWQENLPATELQDMTSSSNIFAFLEIQRAVLEEKIGITTLMKVYKMIAKLEQSDDEKIDYSDLIRILGKSNEELIDDIIQLVVAYQFISIVIYSL